MCFSSTKEMQLSPATWEVWVKPELVTDLAQFIMRRYLTSQGGVMLRLNTQAWPRLGLVELDTDGSEEMALDDSRSARLKQWTHLAVSWGGGATKLYVNGLLVDEGDSEPTFVEGFNQPVCLGTGALGHSFNCAVDEVIVHSVVKSPDYIYRRANPGVPMVRFLSNSEVVNRGSANDPSYLLRELVLHWGDVAAELAVPFVPDSSGGAKCHGLLNSCLGYGAWWKFNEGGGTTAVDSSTANLYATMAGDSSPAWVTGREGAALLFDGVDDGLAAAGDFQFDSSLSVEAAAKPADDETGLMVTWGGATTWLWSLYRDASDLKPRLLVSAKQPPANEAMSIGSWYAVAGTWGDSTVTTYVDGIPGPTSTQAGPLPTDGDSSLGLGKSPVAGAENPFAGVIDSVRIMSRALTVDELLHSPPLSWELD